MNMSNQGGCIHGREFCLECNDKKIPRRPESIGQAHRIMCQMRATIEQQQAEITELKTKLKTAEKWDAIESQRNEELKAEIEALRDALNTIINNSNGLSANPAEWASHIAMKALRWTFENGKAIPPEPPA